MLLDTVWKAFSDIHLFRFALGTAVLLVAGKLLKWTVSVAAKRNRRLQKTVVPAVYSITNWACLYGVLMIFLFDFSNNRWLFYPLYSKGGLDVTPFLLIVALMIVTLAHRLVKLLTKYVLSTVYDHYHVDRGLGYTFNRLIYYTVMIAALCISFTTVGLDLSALGAVLGVIGIGLGFGMRNIAANFVSGIIILFERPIEVGETVEINEETGRVEKINLRATTVRLDKSGTLIVPNQYFIEQVIKNRTTEKPSASIQVSVSSGMDTKKVEKLLHQAFETVKEADHSLAPDTTASVKLIRLRNHSFDFLVEIPLLPGSQKDGIENEMRHVIVRLFRENGIEFAKEPIEQVILRDS